MSLLKDFPPKGLMNWDWVTQNGYSFRLLFKNLTYEREQKRLTQRGPFCPNHTESETNTKFPSGPFGPRNRTLPILDFEFWENPTVTQVLGPLYGRDMAQRGAQGPRDCPQW